jgi:hypothetical protein
VPKNAGGFVQAALLDPFTQVGPAGLATMARVMLLVVPPELEASEGLTGIVRDAQHTVGVEELFDVRLVVNCDPFHFLNPP